MFTVGREWQMLWLLLLPSMAESAGSRILVQANFISHVRRSQQNERKVKIKIIVAGLYQAALQLPAASRPDLNLPPLARSLAADHLLSKCKSPRVEQIHLSNRLFQNTVLRHCVVDIRRFGRYGLSVLSKRRDPIACGRSVVPQNT